MIYRHYQTHKSYSHTADVLDVITDVRQMTEWQTAKLTRKPSGTDGQAKWREWQTEQIGEAGNSRSL